MLPVRLVLDTNIIVSAALKPASLQRTALTIATTKPAQLYVSSATLEEYRDVLARPALKIRKGIQLGILQLLKNHGRLIKPTRTLNVCADPDDNLFVECADAARADYLVTGNLKHYPAFWKGTKIISTREFVELIAPHLMG